MISILALVVIAACIVVAMMYPPATGVFVRPGGRTAEGTYYEEFMAGGLSGARSAALRNVMYLTAAATAVLAVILSISPWGHSKD